MTAVGPDPQPHEIYLRASSAAKKSAPFKLLANVVGRFTVQRADEDTVGEMIRERKNEADVERASRMAILLDKPPVPETKPKKQRKDQPSTTSSSISRKPAPLAPPQPPPKESTPTPPLPALSFEAIVSLRKRLVHFLAQEDRTDNEVVRAIGGPNCNARARQAVLDVLEEVDLIPIPKSSV